MKARRLSMILDHYFEHKMPILIKGAPGIGKSDVVKQSTMRVGSDLILTHPPIEDPTNYKGMPYINEEEMIADFLPFNELKRLIDAKVPTICFLDDIGQAQPMVQNAMMQMIFARQIGQYHISKHVTFVGATNRKSDKSNVVKMSEALKSRFHTIIDMEPDAISWINWATMNKLSPIVTAYVRLRPEVINREPTPTKELNASPSPRTMHFLSDVLLSGLTDPILLDETIQGTVGEGVKAEFMPFMRIWRDLPNPVEILRKPDTSDIPTDIDTKYALTGALAAAVTKKTIDKLLIFANRLEPEFAARMMIDATNRNENLKNTKAYLDWAKGFHDYLTDESEA